MDSAFGVLLLIAYGVFLGAALAPSLVGDQSLAEWASTVSDLTTALGILIGGAWAYGKYRQGREGGGLH
jgi:hypothetical protein